MGLCYSKSDSDKVFDESLCTESLPCVTQVDQQGINICVHKSRKFLFVNTHSYHQNKLGDEEFRSYYQRRLTWEEIKFLKIEKEAITVTTIQESKVKFFVDYKQFFGQFNSIDNYLVPFNYLTRTKPEDLSKVEQTFKLLNRKQALYAAPKIVGQPIVNTVDAIMDSVEIKILQDQILDGVLNMLDMLKILKSHGYPWFDENNLTSEDIVQTFEIFLLDQQLNKKGKHARK